MVNVHSLICHRDIELSLHCLRSIEIWSLDPVRIVLHDDGSLTEDDCDLIRTALNNPHIVRKRDADGLMAEKLVSFPAAAAFRRDSVWGLKLLDIVLLEEDACFYCDGDIRFFRPFRGLFTPLAASHKAVFLADVIWEGYSVRPWHLFDGRRLRISSGINTGLTIVDRSCYDLEFVDWFLGQPDWRCIPAWTEPTCWAALSARVGGHVVSPNQIVNLYPNAEIEEDAIGAHFLSSYRRQWVEKLYSSEAKEEAVADVRFHAARNCSAARLAFSQVKRKCQNFMAIRNARNSQARRSHA